MNALLAASEGFERGDIHVKADSGGWCQAAPGIQAKVLRTCQATGTWVVLYKVKAGTTAAPHVHYGAGESYCIYGKMEVRGGEQNGGKTARAGDYGFEANGARHDATYFAEDTLLLYMNHGPVVYYDEAGNVAAITDFAAMRQLAADPAARVAEDA